MSRGCSGVKGRASTGLCVSPEELDGLDGLDGLSSFSAARRFRD